MTGLRIAPGLTLPLDAVTETFVIVAKRGSGKTYTAAVMVEEMLTAGLPVCVIDPLGVWWGLRSSADGKGDGFPVVIFGGEHADVPLEESAGALIADVLIDQRFPAVLDLSLLSKAAARRFMTAFLTRLYHRNRDPLHVVVDEADLFAPQSTGRGTGGEAPALLGAMEDLVRRGRARGLGCTLITQRPAVLHKDVLSQAEVLVAMRMTGVRDVGAIDEWVKLHADDDTAREVKKSLPSLPIGTAWVWSPGWLDILQRVEVRSRTTFDSSATPKMGERRAAPKRMADVDLKALGEQITATVEKAKADDPRELRARISQLERDLAIERAKPAPAPVEVRVEVPVLMPEIVEQIEAALSPAATLLGEAQETLLKHRMWAETQIYGQTSEEAQHRDRQDLPRTRAARRSPETVERQRPAQRPDPPRGRHPDRPTFQGSAPATDLEAGDVQLKAGARRILETLARHHPMRVTRAQLGTLAKFKVTGGTFLTYWSTLKRHGLVDEQGGLIGLTPAGSAYVGHVDVAPLTTDELLEQWRSALKAGARQMLDVLVDRYPNWVSRDDLAEQVGMTVTGGTFNTYLGTLRRNGLIGVNGTQVCASESLFLAGHRG